MAGGSTPGRGFRAGVGPAGGRSGPTAGPPLEAAPARPAATAPRRRVRAAVRLPGPAVAARAAAGSPVARPAAGGLPGARAVRDGPPARGAGGADQEGWAVRDGPEALVDRAGRAGRAGPAVAGTTGCGAAPVLRGASPGSSEPYGACRIPG